MKLLHAVCFDVDGVLLDSLGAHLQVCEDKSRKYGLNLRIPSPDEFRKLVRRGAQISPMEKMFEAVGFPKQYAKRADEEYQATFATEYPIFPFPGVDKMLLALSESGLRLGLVTANVKANVEHGLGQNMRFFDPRCVFTKDGSAGASKPESLKAIADILEIDQSEFLYVGDQPADWRAAQQGGVPFLGVTFGWGISSEDQDFPTVDDVVGIANFVGQRKAAMAVRKC
jgi:phosphoglycolate phosphatase